MDFAEQIEACRASYVHALETTEQARPRRTLQEETDRIRREVEFRRKGFGGDHERVHRAMADVDVDGLRLLRFRDCGKYATVWKAKDNDAKLKVRSRKCHDRFCPACSREKAFVIGKNVEAKIQSQTARFVTLTLKHRDEPLHAMVDRLGRSFKVLRRTPLWRKTVDGGIAFYEVKYTNGWHAHLHVIVVGSFLDYRRLRRTWLEITGDSYVIDIRAIKETKEAARYCAKYAGKGIDRGLLRDHRRLCEAIAALEGRRLVLTFGDWKGWRVTRDADTTEWVFVGGLIDLIDAAASGNDAAAAVIAGLIGGRTTAAIDGADG